MGYFSSYLLVRVYGAWAKAACSHNETLNFKQLLIESPVRTVILSRMPVSVGARCPWTVDVWFPFLIC
jgi:hypothetical protein